MTTEEYQNEINNHYKEIEKLNNEMQALQHKALKDELDKFIEGSDHKYFYNNFVSETVSVKSVAYINNVEQLEDGRYIITAIFYDYYDYTIPDLLHEYTFVQKQIKLPADQFISNFKAENYLNPTQFVSYKMQCELNLITQTPIMTFDEFINGVEVKKDEE